MLKIHEAIWLHCGDGLVLVDGGTGCLVDANPQAERLLGRSLAAIKSRPYVDLYPADQRQRAAKAFEEGATNAGMTTTLDILRSDGTRQSVDVTTGNFLDNDGRLFVIVSFRDDSARRNAENAVLRLNWALSAIRRANKASVTTQSEAEMMRFVCDGIIGDVFTMAWIGMARDDAEKTVSVAAASGCTAYLDGQAISWDDGPNGKGPTGRAIRLQEMQINNFALTNPAFRPWAERARRHGIESSLSAPLVRSGRAFGALTIYSNQPHAFGPDEVNLFEDLARDIVYALDAKGAFARVRESEQSYRSLFDNMLQGLAYCVMQYEEDVPVDFIYLNVNPAFGRLTGLGNVVGRRVSEIIPGVRESNPELLDTYGRVARGGKPETIETYIHSLGKWFHISVYTPKPEHFVAVFDDITRAKALDKELRQAQKMEALGTFAGGIAHDFNNILTGILGFAQLVIGDADNPDLLADDIGQIKQAANRAKDLVRQILTYSRSIDVAKTPIDLVSLVHEIHPLVRASVSSRIRIELHPAKPAVFVLAAAINIHQLLVNLCLNSADAIGEDTGTIAISVDAALGLARLEVADSGEGIDETVIERIFDPFFTTKLPGKGSGLGLAVVKGIVEDLGGSITIESHGAGTRFVIQLPEHQGTPAAEAREAPAPAAASGRVLVVDDEDAIVTLLTRFFRRMGWDVTASASVREALAHLHADRQFDLVLTDQGMPDETGLDLARLVRARLPRVPIVLISGGEAPNAELLEQSGIVKFMPKPIDLDELVEVINKMGLA